MFSVKELDILLAAYEGYILESLAARAGLHELR